MQNPATNAAPLFGGLSPPLRHQPHQSVVLVPFALPDASCEM